MSKGRREKSRGIISVRMYRHLCHSCRKSVCLLLVFRVLLCLLLFGTKYVCFLALVLLVSLLLLVFLRYVCSVSLAARFPFVSAFCALSVSPFLQNFHSYKEKFCCSASGMSQGEHLHLPAFPARTWLNLLLLDRVADHFQGRLHKFTSENFCLHFVCPHSFCISDILCPWLLHIAQLQSPCLAVGRTERLTCSLFSAYIRRETAPFSEILLFLRFNVKIVWSRGVRIRDVCRLWG